MTDLIRNGQAAARSDQSTAELVKQAADQISRLVRDELRLAQAELTRKGKQAGVGVGTFYRRFPDRDALLDELQRRGCELLLDTLARIKAEGTRGADAIEAYLKECLTMSDELVAMPGVMVT